MMRRSRRNHSPAFKAKVALAEGREDDLRTGAAVRPAPEPDQAVGRLLAGVTSLFDNGLKKGKAADVDITALPAKIGQLTLENVKRVRSTRPV